MKKKLVVSACIILLAVAAAYFYYSDTAYDIPDIDNYNLKENGIDLNCGYIAYGLWQKLFVQNFRDYVKTMTYHLIKIEIINCFTFGNFQKDKNSKIRGVSNFYDPASRFKDSLFGVYILINDSGGSGKRSILKNHEGAPADLENFNLDFLKGVYELNQAVILHTSHEGESGYNANIFINAFHSSEKPKLKQGIETVTDNKNRKWLKISFTYATLSGLTDINKTDTVSLKALLGLPDGKVYEIVDPWHPVTIKGTLLARYFECARQSFWAVVYYNGVSFITRQGKEIDTWKNTDIRQEFEKMFLGLEIGCIGD